MDGLQSLIAFTLAASVLTITPGLDTAFVLKTATLEGSRKALTAALGIVVGCLLWAVSVAAGLGALIVASEVAYAAVRAAGACYLVYLGLRLIFSVHARSQAREHRVSLVPGRAFHQGMLTNLLNPKVGVFYVSFLPQFIPAGANPGFWSLILASIHAALGLAWFWVLIHSTSKLSTFFARPGASFCLEKLMGVVFVTFGLRLAFEKQR